MVLRMRRATILWLLLLILLHAAIGRNIRSVVFDVGFNDGLDTASFLAQGFRVVAVEANAGLVLAFSKKEPFSSALADGRLVLLNVAITNQTGVNVTFYINHLDPKLSTMDPRPGILLEWPVAPSRHLSRCPGPRALACSRGMECRTT